MTDENLNSGFIAYPHSPPDIGKEAGTVCELLRTKHGLPSFRTWEENDVPGRFLITPILQQIRESAALVADVTFLNFNVAFEIGYAIGCKRRVILVRRSDIAGDASTHSKLGIFDTLGHKPYVSASDLAAVIAAAIQDPTSQRISKRHSSGRPRLFLLEAPSKASYDISLLSAVKKSRIGFENYDPSERGRLPAGYAIECVSQQDAFVARFLPKTRIEASIHNTRVAFCAGIAHALGREFLLLQESEEPVPLDYRDLVKWVPNPNDISRSVSELLLSLYGSYSDEPSKARDGNDSLLASLHIGASIAENEGRQLEDYYLQTEQFKDAIRGEIQVVSGRKGAGKTAFFIQLRNSLRRHPQNIIVDLQPEGYQLLKFKERCLSLLNDGSREHLLTALWEYVVLLEVAYRILRDDRVSHVHNHHLNKPYHELDKFMQSQLAATEFSDDGDFSERLDRVLRHVEGGLSKHVDLQATDNVLSNPQVTEILHAIDLRELRLLVDRYVSHKEGLWVLVDNLDKGWPTTGVDNDDSRIIRCLQSALHKIEKPLRAKGTQCRGIVFIRSDVYDRLIRTTPDKGKIRRASLDIANPGILKEILRLRIAYTTGEDDIDLDTVWQRLFVSHISATAEDTLSFILDRCFMRPRCMLDLFLSCRSNAVTVGHEKVLEDDIREGLADYSIELSTNIGYELKDVYPSAPDIIYALIGTRREVSRSELSALLSEHQLENEDEFIDLLLWYGILGAVNSNGEAKYIFHERYEISKLKATHRSVANGCDPVFEINPAFWSALDVETF